MGKIVVTGACGYIGSHTVVDLIENGFEVISIDNNSRSDLSALTGIKNITGKEVKHYAVDLCDREATFDVFKKEDIVGIVHFAALKFVPESVKEPMLYYKNNLESLLNILAAVEEFKVPHFIFSSSCSVYGNSKELPVTELTPLQPAESPYAGTKQMGEEIIRNVAKASQSKFVALRYFNPVGAHPSSEIGENPLAPPENLMPIITEVAIGKRDMIKVFGSDYDTRDGSCVRDYIHVMDIARAHTLAVKFLIKNTDTEAYQVFNLGSGDGTTVLEMIKAFEKVNDVPIKFVMADRRPGDVEKVYANNEKAQNVLGWQTVYDLNDMVKTAWAWEQRK